MSRFPRHKVKVLTFELEALGGVIVILPKYLLAIRSLDLT
jgi:hypothetical protein